MREGRKPGIVGGGDFVCFSKRYNIKKTLSNQEVDFHYTSIPIEEHIIRVLLPKQAHSATKGKH